MSNDSKKIKTAEEITEEVDELVESFKANLSQCQENLLGYIERLEECEQAIFDKYGTESDEIYGNMKSRKDIEEKIEEILTLIKEFKTARRQAPDSEYTFYYKKLSKYDIKIYKDQWLPALRQILVYNFNEKDIFEWYNNIRWHGYVRVSEFFDDDSIEDLKVLEWVLNIPEGHAKRHYNELTIPNEDRNHPNFERRGEILKELNWTKHMMIKMHEVTKEQLESLKKEVNVQMVRNIFKFLGNMTPDPDPRSIRWKYGFGNAFSALVKGLTKRQSVKGHNL